VRKRCPVFEAVIEVPFHPIYSGVAQLSATTRPIDVLTTQPDFATPLLLPDSHEPSNQASIAAPTNLSTPQDYLVFPLGEDPSNQTFIAPPTTFKTTDFLAPALLLSDQNPSDPTTHPTDSKSPIFPPSPLFPFPTLSSPSREPEMCVSNEQDNLLHFQGIFEHW
jgi:hypothetical protein